MNSILLFFAGLLALLLSAIFAVPYFIDWNDYHDVFEAQATKLIGRKVDVGGDVSLTLLPAPVLKFENINVADADGKFDTPFASARTFAAWLSVPPLLKGTIEARAVEIDQPVINLRISKDGTGNWTSLGGEGADLPFIPKEVALNSVKVSDATVNIWREKPEPESVIDKLDGELTARSLQGPYRFNGDFSFHEKRRELRISTGKQEENGEVRLKASIRNPDIRETYSIDGLLRGLSAIPVFKGTFLARLADEQESSKQDKQADEARKGVAPIEIKSEVIGGLTGAQFNNVELVVTKNNKPQTVRGLADVRFQQGLVVGGTFSSRWIDLDSWTGKQSEGAPNLRTALQGLTQQLVSRFSVVRQGSVDLFLDQVVMGGDLINKVRASLSSGENKVQINRLSAELPGENVLRLSGGLSLKQEEPFKGKLSLQGGSLSRLLRWASLSADPGAAAGTGDYELDGELIAGSQVLALENATGVLFDSAFDGAFTYKSGDASELSVTLKSEKLDLARVLGTDSSAKSLWSLLSGSGSSNTDASQKGKAGKSPLGSVKTTADINIGSVSFSGLGESSLEARFNLDANALDIKRLYINSAKKVVLQAGGRLTGLQGQPEGTLTLALQASDAQGVASLGDFFEMPLLSEDESGRLSTVVPLQLTAAVKPADSDSRGLDVHVEGSLGKSDLLLKALLKGAPSKWASSPLDINGRLSNASGIELLRQVRPRLKQGDLAAFADGEGSLSIAATGVAQTGLDTNLVLDAAGSHVELKGKTTTGDGPMSFTGTTKLTSQNSSAALALFGLSIPPGHGAEPASLSSNLASSGSKYTLTDMTGEIGGAAFKGGASIDNSGDVTVVDLQVEAQEASLTRLFAPVVAWDNSGRGPAITRGVTNPGGFWPDAPFDMKLLNRTSGKFSLTADRMKLGDGLVMQNATLKGLLKDRLLKVSSLEGTLAGGKLTASGDFISEGDGLKIIGSAEAKSLRVEQLIPPGDGKPLVSAPVDLTLRVQGEGLSPKGLVSSLTGSGKLQLGEGAINGFSLGAAHEVASTAQAEKKQGGASDADLGKRVAQQLKNSEMAFSTITVPITVRSGVLEFNKIALSDVDGRVTIGSFLQLANMQLDSEWALQSARKSGGSAPRVSMVFTGPLKDIGRIQPTIDTTGLARYVAIRKMERDVERLEKLDVTGKTPETETPTEKPLVPPAEEVTQAPAAAPALPAQKPVKKAARPTSPAPPLPVKKQVEKKPEPETTAQSTPPASAPPAAAPPPASEPPASSLPASEPPQSATSSGSPPPLMPAIPQAAPKPETPAAERPAPAPAAAPATAPAAPQTSPAAVPQAPAGAVAPRRTAMPLPFRKPPVPEPVAEPLAAPTALPAPGATAPAPAPSTGRPAQPSPNLPWLQQGNAAPQGNTAQPAPTQQAAPGSAPTDAAEPQQGETPPAQPPARRFEPFREQFGN